MSGYVTPEGIDSVAVDAWLAAHVSDVSPPFRYELITGGRSNLTYCATDAAGRKLVVRRPPLGMLLATAHDVVREFRIAAALAETPVPVAPALAVCDDPAVNGTPFAVTGFVEGIVLDSADKAAPVPDDARREVAFHLIDVLTELHSVDLKTVGLSDLSRHEGYVERQLRRWSKQWAESKTRELALIDDVGRRLSERIPPQGVATIVHGDYRFGNCIVDLDRREVVAVLDWELCTLGDPLADLGHTGIYWHDPQYSLSDHERPYVGRRLPIVRRVARALRPAYGAGRGEHRVLSRLRRMAAGDHR